VSSFKIVNCDKCGSKTHTLIGFYETIEELTTDIEKGLVRCYTCLQNGDHNLDFDVSDENGKIIRAKPRNIINKEKGSVKEDLCDRRNLK